MKERFVFLFRPTKESFEAFSYSKAFNDACKNCSSCSKRADCKLKDSSPLDRLCLAMPLSTFDDVKNALSVIFTKIADLVLLDLEKDIAYIYKGEGTLEEIKKGSFAKMIYIYEVLANNGDTLFFEVRDLREVFLRDAYLNLQQSSFLN